MLFEADFLATDYDLRWLGATGLEHFVDVKQLKKKAILLKISNPLKYCITIMEWHLPIKKKKLTNKMDVMRFFIQQNHSLILKKSERDPTHVRAALQGGRHKESINQTNLPSIPCKTSPTRQVTCCLLYMLFVWACLLWIATEVIKPFLSVSTDSMSPISLSSLGSSNSPFNSEGNCSPSL